MVNSLLANAYNRGIKKAKNDIAFILSRENKMIKISEAMIDFTYLSEKKFVGEQPIKNFIENQNPNISNMFYVKQCVYWNKFKNLGFSTFEWRDFKSFLNSVFFKNTHSIQNNIELIKFLKSCCRSQRINDVTEEYVCNLPFIWDHKNHLNYPNQVCFPSADDTDWNNTDNKLSFVHKDLLDWLLHDLETKNWLESLDVKEKTDITYIKQNIIPHIRTYINEDNAISEIQKLFSLYRKGDLGEDLIRQLSEIKLMTTKNTLLEATKCYLSDFYNPRLKIENILRDNIFVSEQYCINTLDRDEWKRFLKIIGVNDGINSIHYSQKINKTLLINEKIEIEYFQTSDMVFKPFMSSFWADEFINIHSLTLVNHTLGNNKFANVFWRDYIENYQPIEIAIEATAYWGNYGLPGRISGNAVGNYIPWLIKNMNCVPTLSGQPQVSSSVFLNTNEIKDIAGKYLPIFSGPELSQDWKAFFNFKTQLKLEDYLDILMQISLDIQDDGKMKKENNERIQLVYSILLDMNTTHQN